MTLDGGIALKEETDYIIYTMNSSTVGQYAVVLPKNIGNVLNMIVDLHMKNSFDAVGNGSYTKEQLVQDISQEYLGIRNKYPDGMLVIPMLDETLYQNIIKEQDKQKMFDETKKIGAITSEIYKKLIDSGVDKQKINQQIIMIEKQPEDTNFISWLKEQMPDFVEGLAYSEISPKAINENPFVGNPFAQVTQEEVQSPSKQPSSIFDQVVTEETSSNVVSSLVDTNVFPSSTDIFGGNNASVEQSLKGNDDVFSAAAPSQPIMTDTSTSPVNFSSVSVEEVPKPVENVNLEGTMSLQPTPDLSSVGQSSAVENKNQEENFSAVSDANADHKSGGFANLLILLVVLIGVTVVSVELGKFLYSVYGK